ncbi:MAG TPA: flagellar biosynthetic protein FliO [Xanthobacteraceae bacterium]|nr:flagellar biosynthetic protein FliO [Xanthobacteraceae bacterium]
MLDSLFNMELPLPVKLVVAFAIVLALLAVVMWIFKRLGGNRIGTTATRNRQPRLAVIDAAAVDGRRRLVLVRRDNVEHLIMIGGPSDVVIEQNIVRAVPVGPPREAPIARSPGEPLPRPSAEPSRGPPDMPPRAARHEPVQRPSRAEPPTRRHAEAERSRGEPLGLSSRLPAESTRSPRAARGDIERTAAMADPSLADMAHKLEAALRRPSGPQRGEPAEPASPPPVLAEPTPPTAPDSNGNGRRASSAEGGAPAAAAPEAKEPKEAKEEVKPQERKSMFDSLEEEMASLLGRPPEKK